MKTEANVHRANIVSGTVPSTFMGLFKPATLEVVASMSPFYRHETDGGLARVRDSQDCTTTRK